jgi:hypothetical protein
MNIFYELTIKYKHSNCRIVPTLDINPQIKTTIVLPYNCFYSSLDGKKVIFKKPPIDSVF